MKIIGTLGISLLLLALGCSRQSSHEPVTLTFLDIEWDTPDQMPGLAQDLQEFTRETGIQVKRIPRPDGSFNQLALWRELLQKGTGTPDVVSIDVIWSGILNPYLMDLKPYFATELSSQDPVVAASYTVGDKVVAVPHHAYVGVLLYRPDLLRKYGYREPPKTWDELERMATRIQAGERAKGEKDFWGYVWQGGVDEDLTCSSLEWQISDAGGRIIEDDKTISVNNPRVIRAWQRAARWVGSISPPGVVAYGKWDAQNVWGSGKAAFLRGWQSNYSLITRGWPFSESRSLIRFLLRRDALLMRANEHSGPPREVELYELPSILEPYSEQANSKQQRGGLVARPSIVAGLKYEHVSRTYIEAVHSALTGEKIPSVAAADLEKELIEITGFRKGPPKQD
jgi:trehalose/maltose transport system substrate-binding protein